jgi:hypothetical protein
MVVIKLLVLAFHAGRVTPGHPKEQLLNVFPTPVV